MSGRNNTVTIGGSGNRVGDIDQEIRSGDETKEDELDDEKTLLFVSARGQGDFEPIDSNRELAAIQAELRRSSLPFFVAVEPAATTADLQRALCDEEPDIVHLSGHGTKPLAFLFQDDQPGAGDNVPLLEQARLRARGLRQLLSSNDHVVGLLVFNTCDSFETARRVAPSVGAAIGMAGQISDTAAITFSCGLYQALAAGEALDAAFRRGVAQLEVHFPQEAGLPRLFSGLEEADSLRFASRTDGRRSARPQGRR